MKAQDLLNTDLKVIGQWLRSGLRWWLEELASLAPGSGGRTQRRLKLVAEARRDGSYRISRDGADMGVLREPVSSREVVLVLPREEVLTRRVELPLLPARDTRRMLALDIERLNPLPGEEVFFDAEMLSRDDAARRQTLLLGVVRREAAVQAVERARTFGLVAQALAVGAGGGAPAHLDFLPTMRTGGAAPSRERRLVWWWGAVGTLLALNVAMLVVRDAADVGRIAALARSQQTVAGAALRLRQRVIDEAQARIAQADRQRRTEPLRAIDAVGRALPRGAWVQHFEYNGRTVRLIGYKPASFDIVAALRASPVLANPRSTATDTPAKVAADQPYEVTADLRGQR